MLLLKMIRITPHEDISLSLLFKTHLLPTRASYYLKLHRETLKIVLEFWLNVLEVSWNFTSKLCWEPCKFSYFRLLDP